MKMKKMSLAMLCFMTALSVTACAGNDDTEESSAPSIKTSYSAMSQSTEAESSTEAEADNDTESSVSDDNSVDDSSSEDSEPDEESSTSDEDKPLYLDVAKNTDVDLSKVILNNKELDITDMKISDLLSQTGLTLNQVGLVDYSVDYLFVGKMYHLSDEGTEIGIELVDADGNLVRETMENLDEHIYSEENMATYSVKGISTSDIGEDYEPVFAGGVKIGMLWTDAVDILGSEGEEIGEDMFHAYYFSDGKFVLSIETEKNDDGEGVISDIKLIKKG